MKLRALSLTNVRKFTGRSATIRGIGDGVTVVSEANEFGKSTFFDAVHALFFEKYGSTARPVRSLQPYAGGSVGIAAEVETEQGLFRIEKSFLSRKSARVLRLKDNATIAQDDEAERWIATLLGPAGDGPAGLLWVRQGLVGLEPDKAGERAAQMETRRDLLSSVGAEVDTLTGGRRMDRAMRQVAEDLAQITTPTRRKSGEWKLVTDQIAAMETELASLDAQVAALEAALSGRRDAEAERLRLDDPDARARREAALAAARAALEAAQAHGIKLRAAAQQADIAGLHFGNAQKALDTFLAAVAAARSARDTAERAARDVQDGAAEVEILKHRFDAAQTAHSEAVATLAAARRAFDHAQRSAAAAKAHGEAQALAKAIADAELQAGLLDKAAAALRASVADDTWLRRVEKAEAEMIRIDAALQAQATTLRLDYDGRARVLLDGSPLPDGKEIILGEVTRLDLPGIGRMAIRSGGATPARTLTADLAKAKATLAALLSGGGVPDTDAARAAAATRAEAQRQADLATGLLRVLAPNGIDALRRARSAAETAAGAVPTHDLPPLAQLESARAAAMLREQETEADRKSAEAAHSAARERVAVLREKAASSALALSRADLAAGPEPERAGRQAGLLQSVAELRAALDVANAAHAALIAQAPDLATLTAEEKRCAQAVAVVADRRAQVSDRLIALSAEIQTLAGNGVEERLDELSGKLDAARHREGSLARQAAALIRLHDALLAQRTAAHDAYFGPVRDELRPLLSILHRDADLAFDGDSLLPGSLTRGADTETLEALSGGTREQIAILTRLAFARLFARKGRHMPIILDDALVYSDDDRIVKMFTALTRVSQDQQIIVFSCRQLAFQDLGGARPKVEISTA